MKPVLPGVTRKIDHRHDGVPTFGAELHRSLLVYRYRRNARKVLKIKALLTIFPPPSRVLGKTYRITRISNLSNAVKY